MLFNSIDFAIFLPVVFIIYWFLVNRNLKLQNLFVVIASYIFYGWWDWRFLSLLLFSTTIDFYIGRRFAKLENSKSRKLLLWISIVTNLGFLGFFKYFNFFIENFTEAFSFFGMQIKPNTLNIILPVGISFYTFQTLSYTIDVYKKKLKPTRDFIAFAAFVSFFPQLVAGPIERATNLLPQFQKERSFDYSKAVDGMRQILWGLFKKIVIADNCAQIVNMIFNNSIEYSGSTLFLGALFFSFQIYCDFSGYSDIAIGAAKLFGFKLMKNFAFPYFSRDIAEFWRRWHISLSTWFRDYLYIPLGGSQVSNTMKIRNVFIIFLVSGFWHGANWTFIAWGVLNAIYFLPLMLTKNNRNHLDTVAHGRIFPNYRDILAMGTTFLLTVLAWIFFRAESMQQAFFIFSKIFSTSLFSLPALIDIAKLFLTVNYLILFILLIITFVILEWLGRENEYAIEKLGLTWNSLIRRAFYFLLIICIFYISGQEQQFIYFQF